MIKVIGSAMIIFSGLGIGMYLSAKEKRHAATIGAIEKMFCETKLMLKFEAVTFKELMGYLKKSSQTRELKFLSVNENSLNLRQDIIGAIKKNEDNLSDDEVFQLEGFFLQFGETDLDGQILLAEKYGEVFRERFETLRQENIKKCKLYNSLGVLGGAFIAVMLI